MTEKIPELLAPAGSREAFCAALAAGADAVYLGIPRFNARINAKNFDMPALREAAAAARLRRKKIYVALNTLLSDRECDEALSCVRELTEMGLDTFIVQDLGFARLLKAEFPDALLHASTQTASHNAEQARLLAGMGFSRMIAARELDREALRSLCRTSPIETEVFIHGALCVSHSGQCLFSSIVGGRSGNRGECAQPCRLEYDFDKGNAYPLSLKDLCLAGHIPELIETGVSSLKIEGRMKPPSYVYGVVSIYRRLLDERRAATESEQRQLAAIFSRNGFTDGYYTGKKGKGMYGIRRVRDKELSARTQAEERYALHPVPIAMTLALRQGEPAALTSGDVTVYGPVPEPALSRPLSAAEAEAALSKLGGTPFYLKAFRFFSEGEQWLPLSALNTLRRALCAEYEQKLTAFSPIRRVAAERPVPEKNRPEPPAFRLVFSPCCRLSAGQILRLVNECPLPLEGAFVPAGIRLEHPLAGCLLPAVMMPGEREALTALVRKSGAKRCLADNLGTLAVAGELGLKADGGIRLNAYNSHTVSILRSLGLQSVTLSPELTPAQRRDIVKGGKTAVHAYGRLPLMMLENCLVGNRDGCGGTKTAGCCARGAVLTDRKKKKFLAAGDFFHRGAVYNSMPTYLGDRQEELKAAGISVLTLYFTDENPRRIETIFRMFEEQAAFDGEFTRK